MYRDIQYFTYNVEPTQFARQIDLRWNASAGIQECEKITTAKTTMNQKQGPSDVFIFFLFFSSSKTECHTERQCVIKFNAMCKCKACLCV